MFGEKKRKLTEKYSKDRTARTEREGDSLKEFLSNELANLEKLLSDETKLKQMTEDKRREISNAIKRLDGKTTLFKEEGGKIPFRFKDLFENKEIEKEKIEKKQIEGQVPTEGTESNCVGEDEENEIKSQQEDWELRLQSKEEENNLLKKQIAEMEEQFRIEREKKEQEIQELKKRLEEMSGEQESV